MMDKRQIEKRDNFFSIELKEGEEVQVIMSGISNSITDNFSSDAVVFIVPFNCKLNCYMKRDSLPLQYK